MSQDALDLLLSGVKDQGQRKQITSAYYAFANGDPETFAVQFAVLLRAHAMSLKLLPARLEKTLATETRKLGDLVIAHQNSVQRMASSAQSGIEKERGGGGDRCLLKDPAGDSETSSLRMEVLRREREKIDSAVTAHGKLLQRWAARRMFCALIVSYIGGVLTIPILQELVSFIVPMLR